MVRKPCGFSRRSALIATAALCVCIAPFSRAQAPLGQVPQAPGGFDPADVYFQGWLLSNDAEKLAAEGKNLEALQKLRRAKELFDNIGRHFPEWKPDMLKGRLEKTTAGIAEVIPAALKEQNETTRAIAELEGGSRRGGGLQGDSPQLLDTGIPEAPIRPARPVDTLESRRMAELEADVGRLQRQIQATGDPNGAAREASRAGDLERQRDLAQSQLKRSRDELDRLRQRFAEAPMQDEIRGLSQRIDRLELEKEVLAQSLGGSQAETREANAQIAALQQERARLMQEEADLRQNLEIERKTSNDVVDGQRRQLQHFQEQLRQKDQQLAAAGRRIEQLQTQLNEVRAELQGVREENEGLIRERDQMAALLRLNEAGQLQQLVDQNMALARELREHKERYDALQTDNDATKEDLLDALRDLAISKRRIQEFRAENLAQQERMARLEERLRSEEKSLATTTTDPAEFEALRGIIQRQLRIQDKRRHARELLMGALDDKAREDEQIRQAMALFQGAELNLSPDELRLIEDEEVDGVLISPYARPREEVARSLAGLERELEPIHNVGTKAYLNGRLHAAREAFLMILERNEGDAATMCKLGLVELRLEDGFAAADMFRRATELDPGNPYAHRMLGYSLGQLGDNREALPALERAVQLAPTNPENQILLGNLQFRLGDFGGAEESFKTAIACDENAAEPHYNLAFLYAREGKKKQGLEHYRKALELGVAPNLELEKTLAVSQG